MAAAPRVVVKVGEPVPPVLWGRHKGSEILLMERGLLQPGCSLRGACESQSSHAADGRCCCKRLLALQPDFRSETSALERVAVSGGHRCLFLPKYHCELNWIERYWGAAKKYARRHCGYSLPALRMCVPIALSQTLDELPAELRADPQLPVSSLFKQRRFARVSWRYAAEYRKGESGHVVVREVLAQSSSRHRDTSRMRQSEAAMEALAMFDFCYA
jgi:transposase